MLLTHFKIKYNDREFYLLYTEGDLDEFHPKTDKNGNLISDGSIKYVYSSRLWIHNNILMKNQTLLNFVEGQFMSQSDINFLLSLKVLD